MLQRPLAISVCLLFAAVGCAGKPASGYGGSQPESAPTSGPAGSAGDDGSATRASGSAQYGGGSADYGEAPAPVLPVTAAMCASPASNPPWASGSSASCMAVAKQPGLATARAPRRASRCSSGSP